MTVPPTSEQVSEQPPCLTDQLLQLKDADKEHDQDNLNLLFLTILFGVHQTIPKNVFSFSFLFRGFVCSRYCISQRLQNLQHLSLVKRPYVGLEPSSPVLGPGVNHYPSRFIFRTSLKGRLRNDDQIANQRRALAAVALCHLPTRESLTIEKSSKNNCTRGKD